MINPKIFIETLREYKNKLSEFIGPINEKRELVAEFATKLSAILTEANLKCTLHLTLNNMGQYFVFLSWYSGMEVWSLCLSNEHDYLMSSNGIYKEINYENNFRRIN